MSVGRWIDRLFRPPGDVTATYVCRDCAAIQESSCSRCPECGGAIIEHRPDPSVGCWGPLM